jgi:hypothetical protein
VFGTFSIAMDNAIVSSPDAERLMGLLAFLASDNIPVDMIGSSAMDTVERVGALEALTAVSLVIVKDRHVRVHRIVQEVMRQRVHEKGAFPSLRGAIHGMLREALAKERYAVGPAYDLILESILWALHYDPQPDASIEVEYDFNEHVMLEQIYYKRPDGILRVLRAMNDMGAPRQREEWLYYLKGGWESRKVMSWNG